MASKQEKLVKIIDFWQKLREDKALFNRELVDKIDVQSKEVVDIVGPRRSGKSSILKLIIKKLQAKDESLFINFEDPFFIENNGPEIIEELVEVYLLHFNKKLKYLFLDEIQNIKNWEKAVRKLRDTEKYKIFITGSSSKLLSSELSSLLTGRHNSYKLMPLNFKEYLAFKEVEIKTVKDLILQENKIKKLLNNFLALGGFPSIVLLGQEELLKQYYSDIVERDIVGRFDIRQKDALQKMGVFLLSNSGKFLSLASLQKSFNLAFEAAENYLEYFREAFLVCYLQRFSYSLKTQAKSFKKVYAVDTGLVNSVSFRFSEDRGRVLENAVFLALLSKTEKLFYYRSENNLEVDFYVFGKKEKLLVQVCANLDDPKTKQREVRALLEAGEELKCKNLTVVSPEYEAIEEYKGRQIFFQPLWKWLLQDKNI